MFPFVFGNLFGFFVLVDMFTISDGLRFVKCFFGGFVCGVFIWASVPILPVCGGRLG